MNQMITKIDLNNKVYGGRVYENQIIDLLQDCVEFRRVFLIKHKTKILDIPRILYLLIKYRFFYKGTLLLTNQTTWLAGRRSKNIIVIHHLDFSSSKKISQYFQKFCEKALIANKNRFSNVITVAQYWKTVLVQQGFKNVQVIYNSFNPELYRFTEKEKIDFKKKYGFLGKPIIYLGNCQKKKGVLETYKALQEIDAYFVTSGTKDIELPIPNLILSYKDYRLLLASSDIVITMSLFKEGWNRTAHESILCGTPVIGSGSGGMKELLEESDQIICHSFEDLPSIVEKILHSHISVRDEFVRSCNLEYFKLKWLQVLTEKEE